MNCLGVSFTGGGAEKLADLEDLKILGAGILSAVHFLIVGSTVFYFRIAEQLLGE
jgi:hypothetical protein